MMNKEIRSFTAPQPFAVRTLPTGEKQVSGYAIVFSSPSVDLGGFVEVCDPKMLTRTLKQNPDVLALRDHKSEMLLGRTTAGTLALTVDSTGLRFAVTLPKTSIGDDTAENVRLRNLTGCSFGFNTVEDQWTVAADGSALRTLLDVDLFEISITSFPAYQETSVEARSHAAQVSTKRADPGDPDAEDELEGIGDDVDDSDDDDADDELCSCRCERCIMSDCRSCYRMGCEDRNCRSNSCPQQDEQRADALRLTQMFHSRRALNN
jgi:HK97 family phage prohead protease